MTKHLVILPGDGIGPEVTEQAENVLKVLTDKFGLQIEVTHALIGGAAIDAVGDPLPDETLSLLKRADAVLLGAVGGPKWDDPGRAIRPEQGLLKMRRELGVFANLRPAILFDQLQSASSLKTEVVAGLDMLIVRELTGGIYFGEPRGSTTTSSGERACLNTMIYSEPEVERIAHSAFRIAMQRQKKLCSVDKANVLDVSRFWREIVIRVAQQYPEVSLSHLYVDNAAMQLVRDPKQFDVIVTSNLFGDILSDCAAMLTGSIGMLPSASLNDTDKGVYEPVHGSAPDIAGQGKANPLATILSLAMMLRYTFHEQGLATRVESAVKQALEDGLRTTDIYTEGTQLVNTQEMGQAVVNFLNNTA